MVSQATKTSKKRMIKALQENRGLVTYASKACRIARSTHYKWLKEDEDYAKEVSSVEDLVLDQIENSALDMIADGKNPAVTIFYLKTKGKKRGFIEKSEVEHSLGGVEKIRELIKEYDDDYEYDD